MAARPSCLSDVVGLLSERYPDVPLVALGQTVLWDEPMKAVLWGALQEASLCTRLWFGVHDTDYFAKPPIALASMGSYEILPHNDGTTKDLWVAMGELSCLFGAEVYASREELAAHGVPVEKMARSAPEGREAWIDRVTEAWGWRGLAYTGSRRKLAADVKLRDSLDALVRLLEWGYGQTVSSLEDPGDRQRAREAADALTAQVRRFAADHPQATLSQLFQHLLPYLLEGILGRPPACTRFGCSRQMFQFNRATARRPRFEPLDLFLNPATRPQACAAYNAAVQGSEIYTLDRFGEGAIPFDLVVPGRGRGTLQILPGKVVVQADEPLYLKCEREITSVADLADFVEEQLGPEVSLVGKAVVLITMICRESIGVFSVTGSGYIWRTRRFSEHLAASGISLPLYPILRLDYPTWDALRAVAAPIRLPDHLAQAFGQETITGPEFADRWRGAVKRQREVLREVAALKSPRDLMAYLASAAPNGWQERLDQYSRDHEHLLSVRERIQTLKDRTQELYSLLREAKARVQAVDRAKGEDFRATIYPLKERLWEASRSGPASEGECADLRHRIREHEERRRTFDEQWEAARARVREIQAQVRETRAARRALETAPETTAVRRRLAETDQKAQEARLDLVRNAILASKGLERAAHRPSAWWFLLVSPGGEWFREVQHGTQAYFEPLAAVEPTPVPRSHCMC